VDSLHVGIVLDSASVGGITTPEVQNLVTSALGIDPDRGDTVEVSAMQFDRSAEEAAAKALAEAKAAEKQAELMAMLKTGALALVVAGIFFAAWLRGRKRRQARDEATTYVVEQLRRDAAERTAVSTLPAAAALEAGYADEDDLRESARDEIAALVERQPEEVAQLLRGWLVGHGG